MSDEREITYDTNHPTGKRTVDRAPREAHPDNDRALEQLRRIVSDLDVRNTDNVRMMAAPHIGNRLSQRQTARKILAGRSYQAVQAWLSGEPMPGSVIEWLTHDLQRVDAGDTDRMVPVAADEIAILVKNSRVELGRRIFLVTLNPLGKYDRHVKAAFRSDRDRELFLERLPNSVASEVHLSSRTIEPGEEVSPGHVFAVIQRTLTQDGSYVADIHSVHPSSASAYETALQLPAGPFDPSVEMFAYSNTPTSVGAYSATIPPGSTAVRYEWSWTDFPGAESSGIGANQRIVGFGRSEEEALKFLQSARRRHGL